MQDRTQSGMYNATQQAAQYIQHMTTQVSTHPAILQAQSSTITAVVMFPIGFLVGGQALIRYARRDTTTTTATTVSILRQTRNYNQICPTSRPCV